MEKWQHGAFKIETNPFRAPQTLHRKSGERWQHDAFKIVTVAGEKMAARRLEDRDAMRVRSATS